MSSGWQNPYQAGGAPAAAAAGSVSPKPLSVKAALAEENRRKLQARKIEGRFVASMSSKNFALSGLDEVKQRLEEEEPRRIEDAARRKEVIRRVPTVQQAPAPDGHRHVDSFGGDIAHFEITHGGAHVWTADSVGNLQIRSGLQGRVVHTLEGDEGVTITALWASPTHMFVGTSTGLVRIYDHSVFISITEGTFHSAAVTCFTGLAGGRTISCAADGTLVKWDSEAKGFEALLKIITGHTAAINQATSASYAVFTASQDTTIRVIDSDTGAATTTLRGHEDSVGSVVVISSLLVSASADSTVRFWSLVDYSVVKVVKVAAPIKALVVDIASLRLWAARLDGVIEVWRCASKEDISFENSITTSHEHPVESLRLLSAVDSVKIWSIASNGVNKVWYSSVNRVEAMLTENVSSLKAVISQDAVEIDRWRDLIQRLKSIDTRRKDQMARALSVFFEDMLRRRHMWTWKRFVMLQLSIRRKKRIALKLEEQEQLRLRRRYFSKLFQYCRMTRMKRLKETYVQVLQSQADKHQVRSSYAKLQSFVRKMKEAKKRREISHIMSQQMQRGQMRYAFRKWLKWAMNKKQGAQRLSYVSCLMRSSELSLRRVYYIKLRTFALRGAARQRKVNAANMLVTLNARGLRRSVFSKWMMYVALLRAKRRKVNLAECFLANSQRCMQAMAFRRIAAYRLFKIRQRREKELEDGEAKLALVRAKYAELQKLIAAKQENERLQAVLESKRQAMKEREVQLSVLSGQRDDLSEMLAEQDRDAALRAHSWREQLANLLGRLKAKVINYHADFALVTQIREKTKQLPVLKIFLEAHQAVKRIVVDLTKKPHLPVDEEWPVTFQMLNKIPAFQMSVLLNSIKTMIITFDMMDTVTRDSMTTDQEIVINAKWLLYMADSSMEHRRQSLGGKK